MTEDPQSKSLFGKDLFGELVEQAGGKLQQDFVVPPFSVLDCRQGYWQERKRAWVSLGIESELGRADDLMGAGSGSVYSGESECAGVRGGQRAQKAASYKGQESLSALMGSESYKTGTSIFDPVLCELAYTWFCPPGGTVLDPFAGGSVRGIVAAFLGYQYIGVDLSEAQVQANQEQAEQIVPDNQPRWIIGDSRDLSKLLDARVDFLFTCPPYYDLEVYSEDPRDLSLAGDYREFLDAHRDIVWQAVDLLKPNRFACWVVGDIRDKEGYYRTLPFHTMLTFVGAGLRLYNEAVLITAVGSLPVRIGKQFRAGRKLGKSHQNILVFVKGNSKKAAQACQ